MAAPNIVNVTSIIGKTGGVTPANTNPTVLLANNASSGQLLKVNAVLAANTDTAQDVLSSLAIAPNADGSGTNRYLGKELLVPMNAVVVHIDKATPLYLEENTALVVTSGKANALDYTVSYEVLT